MKTGIKKAAIVMAAIALLSACGSNFKVETNPELGQEYFEQVDQGPDPDSLAMRICEAVSERGQEGYNSIRKALTQSIEEKATMDDFLGAAINWKCPEFAK